MGKIFCKGYYTPKEELRIKAILGVMESGLKYLKWLEKEVKSLSTQRKLYTIQSEWYKLMYAKTLELETLRKALADA
jgi:hypothetical protein